MLGEVWSDMLIYAGIDEAGYGPMFGPFVVSRCVFAIKGAEGGVEPPDLWEVLDGCVCRKGRDKRRRVAVGDSKKLYTPKVGLAHLERAVLTFGELVGVEAGNLEGLLAKTAHDEESKVADQLWYNDEEGGPALPSCMTEAELGIAKAVLEREMKAAEVKVMDIKSAVVYEDRFNALVAATRSKARCTWTFVSQHIYEVWSKFGKYHPWMVIDRQGGRKVYHQLLQLMFPDGKIRLLDESDDCSRYRIEEGMRVMTISFETKSDDRHLPVALASMTAKYTRELLMRRFNRFFEGHDPGLKPTAGYVQDGRRFLKDITPIINRLGIEESRLVRSR